MVNQSRSAITANTVRLVTRILYPWKAEGVLFKDAYDEIIVNLKHLAEKGSLFPCVVPKLVNQREAAGLFPFRRKMVGASVRYRNLDIVKFILTDDEEVLPIV